MSRLPVGLASVIWSLIAFGFAVQFFLEKAYIALGVEVLILVAMVVLSRSAGGRSFLNRLKLPVLAIVSAFIVGGIVLILSDLEFYTKFGADPIGTLVSSLGRVAEAYGALIVGALGDPGKISTALASGNANKIGIALRRG